MATVERPLVDLHAHSDYSYDGGISIPALEEIAKYGSINPHNNFPDVLAVTDHDVIAEEVIAISAASAGRIIVGEEVTTQFRGSTIEIVGLYLKEAIPEGKDTLEVMHEIHAQDGLVYIPHPFNISKKGVPREFMNELFDEGQFDILEVSNSRIFPHQRYLEQDAESWANMNSIAIASGTDSHGVDGLNGSGNYLSEYPTRKTLVQLLGTASLSRIPATFKGRSHPFRNKVGKKLSAMSNFGLQLIQQ